MTVSDLISEVTYDLGGKTSRAGRRFRALSSAMDNYGELKAWHQDLFDSSLDFLLRSGNEEWVDNLIERKNSQEAESVLLGDATLWLGRVYRPREGILPPRDFGRSIAEITFERDLMLSLEEMQIMDVWCLAWQSEYSLASLLMGT